MLFWLIYFATFSIKCYKQTQNVLAFFWLIRFSAAFSFATTVNFGNFLDLTWLDLALVCGVFCEFVTFPLVSWVRCGTWLYRFLIFATLLTLILSLFFYCCRCPRYWVRQQVARVSNTQSPCLSVQWINAAKAAHFHVSLNTLRPGLCRSSSSSGGRNRHTWGFYFRDTWRMRSYSKIKPSRNCAITLSFQAFS